MMWVDESGLNDDNIESDSAMVLFGILMEDDSIFDGLDSVFDGLDLIDDGRVDCVEVGCVNGRKAAERWEDVDDGNNEDEDAMEE